MVTAKDRYNYNQAVKTYESLTKWHTKFAWLPKFIYSSDKRRLVWLKKYHVIYCVQLHRSMSSAAILMSSDYIYFRVADTCLSGDEVLVEKLKGNDIETNYHDPFTKEEICRHIADGGTWTIVH